MWTKAHRARHQARLKDMVRVSTVGAVARWLERADPPRSPRRTPLHRIVAALAWHLRVGGPWRALPGGFPPWRTVYGWFRRWLEAGGFDALMQGIARLRRRSVDRRAGPRLCIIGTPAVKGISVRGPRGYDAGKGVWGRKRVALVDAAGHWLAVAVVPASVQSLSSRRRGTATPFRRWTAARRCGPACGKRSMMAPSPPSAAGRGRTGTACAITSSSAIRRPKALSSSRGAGWWNAALAGWRIGTASRATAPDASMSPLGASPSSPSSPALRPLSIQCQFIKWPLKITQTGS